MDTIKTFVIEDSPVILESLVEALVESAPVTIVGHADTEQAALAWLHDASNRCDVIVVDIFLKSGTGLGVLKRIGELAYKPLRVVVLSNYATAEMRRRCTDLGADEVFDKSSEIDELLAWFNNQQVTQ
jgi:DNA-binding NarL/FixJ family response regulator